MPGLFASLVALAVFTAPNTEGSDCDPSGERYRTAISEVVEAMRAYGRCVAQSDRHDDCAAEIQALDNAHDDFADAVADAKDCQ